MYLTANLEGNDDGLLQRFQLLIYPEIKGEWKNIDVIPNANAFNLVQDAFNKIDQIPEPSESSPTQSLHFDNEPQEIFNLWRKDLEKLFRSNTIQNESFESHLAKYRSLMPSLALIFYILKQNGEINFSNDNGINKESTLLAIKWCDYLKQHAQKVYQIHGDPLRLTVKALIEKIKSGQIGDGDPIRGIQRHRWPHLKTAKDIKEGIIFLSKYGWTKIENNSKGSRESLVVRLNPAL